MLKAEYYTAPTDIDLGVFDKLIPQDHYLRRLKAARSEGKVIFLTMHADAQLAAEAPLVEWIQRQGGQAVVDAQGRITEVSMARTWATDAAAMTTRFHRDGDHVVLSGTKRFITGAGVSHAYLVFATTDPALRAKGVSAFLVMRDDPGVSFGKPEKKMGIKGSPTREVILDETRIPADRMVGAEGEGFSIAMRTLDHSRPVIAAQAVGIAQGALDLALSYGSERKQFGERIVDFEGIKFMLADMAMKVEAARVLTYRALAACDAGDPRMAFHSSVAKCFASDAAMAVTTDAVQILGGYGYVREYPAERFMRDAKITQIYEGTNQIQRLVIARELLKLLD